VQRTSAAGKVVNRNDIASGKPSVGDKKSKKEKKTFRQITILPRLGLGGSGEHHRGDSTDPLRLRSGGKGPPGTLPRKKKKRENVTPPNKSAARHEKEGGPIRRPNAIANESMKKRQNGSGGERNNKKKKKIGVNKKLPSKIVGHPWEEKWPAVHSAGEGTGTFCWTATNYCRRRDENRAGSRPKANKVA